MSENVRKCPKNLLIKEVKVSEYIQNKHWESDYLSLILNALSFSGAYQTRTGHLLTASQTL